MKPLQSVAMGLVIIAVAVRFQGYDVIPDPVGWVLVLAGLGGLPPALPHRRALGTVAGLGLATSIVLWFPALAERLAEEDVALVWLASLPQLVLLGLVCRALALLARATDPGAASWLHTGLVLTLTAAALMTYFLATIDGEELADSDALVLGLSGFGALVLVIVLLFRYSARPWALPALDQTSVPEPGRGS